MKKKGYIILSVICAVVLIATGIILGVVMKKQSNKKTYTASIKTAEKYLEAGDYTQAVVAYKTAIEKMPEKEKKAIWGEQIRILREAIYGSEEELEKQIEVIFSGIREKEYLEDWKMLLPSLSNLLGELCESENCKEIDLKEPLYTIREIEQYYCRNFSYIQQKYARKARLGYSRTVLDMIDYIEKNYPQELSLELLGEKFHMNGVYLGQIFKKETGQTFLKYLTNVRISEAKRLLWEENSTVAETAQMVGYRTSQYFSQIFMRNVGMKPQEYKKQRKE